MHPVLFKFQNIIIHSYTAAFILSFFTIFIFSFISAKKKNINTDHIINITIISTFCMLAGTRLLYVITHYDLFKGNFFNIFNMENYKGNMGLGGIVLTSICIFLYCYIKKIQFLEISDVIMPYFFLCLAIFRLGCFLNGCCFGKPTSLPWGLIFPQNSHAGMVFTFIKIHPVQLYLVMLNVIFFIIIILIEKKQLFQGFITSLGLILYGSSRFTVDFFRYYDKNFFINLLFITMPINQLISFFIIIIGVILMIILLKKKRLY